jgi:tetratricopeptide (TPR) repeat protein
VSRRLAAAVPLVLLLIGACAPQQGLVRPPGNAFELRERAEQAYAQGDWLNAEKEYRALTRAVPTESEPWFRLGNIYAHLNQPEQALAAYKEALIRDPKNGKAWHNTGIVQLRQATSSFLALQQVTEAEDPLHQRAQKMVESVMQLLEQDFAAGAEAAEAPAQ